MLRTGQDYLESLRDGREFDRPGAGDWLRKYFSLGEIPAEERRKLFALARDLLNPPTTPGTG